MLRIPKGKKQSRAHVHAPKQEIKAAKRLGAVRVHRSGAGDVKGDVRKKRVFRLECKCTEKKSFSVTREMIDKIEDAALATGELPVIEIDFLTPAMIVDGPRGFIHRKIAVVPSYVLDQLANPQ